MTPPDLGPDAHQRIEAARRAWEERTLNPALARSPERPALFADSSGAPVERLFTPVEVAGLDYLADLGFPGEFPYTRGVQPTGYRGRLWTMRQYAGFGSAVETNRRFRYLLDQGQSGLSVAFDLPTQMGYDADHPMARSEAGKVGVAISSVADMEELFDGIPLDRVSTSMTINATASILLCLYIAVAERQGVALGEALRHGAERHPEGVHRPRHLRVSPGSVDAARHGHLRLLPRAGAALEHHLDLRLPRPRGGVHGGPGSGVHSRQRHRLRQRRPRGRAQAVDDFAPQLSFFFNAHNNLLEEVAKFRAARRLWARMMRERFGARDPRSQMLRFHAQTAGSMLTAQQPENNIVRVAIQALAAVLGGCQSLHTNSMDEALSLPSEAAVRIALRTQQILAYESGVVDTVDPLGGSYAVERMTRRIEEEAETYIAKIDGLGGSVHAIAFMQREIQDAAYRYQQEVESRARVVVGVNDFVTEESAPGDLFQLDPRLAEALAERLDRLRKTRDADSAQRALEAVERTARGPGNLIPPILDAVRARVTLGEICDTLRGIFGVFQASVVI